MVKVEKNGVIKEVSKDLAKHYVRAGWKIKKEISKNVEEKPKF